MNVMNINEKTAILESCFTEKYGTKARFSNLQFENPRFRHRRNWGCLKTRQPQLIGGEGGIRIFRYS